MTEHVVNMPDLTIVYTETGKTETLPYRTAVGLISRELAVLAPTKKAAAEKPAEESEDLIGMPAAQSSAPVENEPQTKRR